MANYRNLNSDGFPGGPVVKTSLASAGDERDVGLIPGSARYPGGGHGNRLQYSCLENPMDRRAWWATVHGVAMSRTRLKLVKPLSLHAYRVMCRISMRTDRLESWDWRVEQRAATAPCPLYAVWNVFLIFWFVPLPILFPLVTISVVSASVTQFLFCK